MKLLLLIVEFFKTGLFSVGGGLATLPFLYNISDKYGWFTRQDLADMIAISESTPGPIGINMATYVGFSTCGFLGGIAATLAIITPSIIVSIIVEKFLDRFGKSTLVQSAFYGLRPTVTALIAAAMFEIVKITMFNSNLLTVGNLISAVNLKAVGLAVLLYFLIKKYNKHPIIYILGAAVVGIIFKF